MPAAKEANSRDFAPHKKKDPCRVHYPEPFRFAPYCEMPKGGSAAGATQISVTADADLGEGVTPIVGTLSIDVVGGQAVSINIVAGTPAEQA